MSISSRLSILITVAVLCLLGVAGYAIHVQAQLMNMAQNFSENDYPSLDLVESLRADGISMRLAGAKYLLAHTPDRARDIRQEMENMYAKAQKRLQQYEPLINDDTDRKLWDDDKTTLAAFHDSLLRLFDALDQNNNELAASIRSTQATPAGNAMEKAINAHVAYNVDYVKQEVATNTSSANQARLLMIVISIVAAAFTLINGLLTKRSIMGPMSSMRKAMLHISQHLDFTKPVNVSNTRDEIGVTVTAFNGLVEKMRHSLREMNQQCSTVAGYASQLATAANQVQHAAAQQSDYSSEMASAIEQLTVSINHIGDQSGTANDKTVLANQLAYSGQEVIGSTVQDIQQISNTVQTTAQSLHELEESTNSISSAVSSIKDIADQTNLLALNAAIEAARAGEQGRGFAVVADEVRKLAEHTTELTSGIGKLIQNIETASRSSLSAMTNTQQQVKQGVERAGTASDSISQIGSASKEVLSMVTDINRAIKEQTIASHQIAGNIERISQMAEEASAASKQSASIASQLHQASETMVQAVNAYKV